MAVLAMGPMLAKKHRIIEGLPVEISESLGQIPYGFQMIVWGQSGQGKSELVMMLLSLLLGFGRGLYVGLEEGFGRTMQLRVLRHLDNMKSKRLEFADHEMTIDALMLRLDKPKSARWVVIDSVQYWGIDYEQYKTLKERYPNKGFIFISHAKGRDPDGAVAKRIRYDVPIKINVEGMVGFVVSRFMGGKPLIISEDVAKKYWGTRRLNNIRNGKYTK